jgi:phage terminase small subunit
MGKRGPKPTPTAKLQLRGSWRGNIRKKEPVPLNNSAPECPEWLNGEARNAWEKIAPQLSAMGCLENIDGFPFSRYCVYMVLWLKELGNPARSEATLDKYANQLNRLEQSFGLTPSARTNIAVGKKEESDKFIRAV